MKRLAQRSAFAVFAWVIALAASSALAQFTEMTSRVPESANMISLINVEQVLASPMAVKEGWDQDPVKRFAAGLTSIPSGSNQLLFATQMDLELMRPVWELGMIQLDEAPSATELAEKHGGTRDSVAGFPAVRLSDDSYVIRFSDKLVDGYTPGNRQAVSRWICNTSGSLPPYLQEAIGYATRGAEFIIALDLKDAVATEDARKLIDDFDSRVLKDAGINPEDLADLLAGVQGAMLGITFNERAFGKIKVDFDRDASMLSGIAKPLFLEILEQRGLMIDEFRDWKAEVEGKRVMFGGYLTASGLMRLSSLVDLPTRALHDLPRRGESDEFHKVNYLLRNLRGRKSGAKTHGQVGQWYEMYARKIGRLPISHVDDHMLDYGGHVAGHLQSASIAMRGGTIQSYAGGIAAVNQGVVQTYFGRPFRRPMTRREAIAARMQVRSQAMAQSAVSVMQTEAQIDAATAEIRRLMAKKYQVEL